MFEHNFDYITGPNHLFAVSYIKAYCLSVGDIKWSAKINYN